MFAFPIDEELNDAVKAAARALVRLAPQALARARRPAQRPAVTQLLARFPQLTPREDVLAWLSDSGKWRGLVSLSSRATERASS